MTLSGVGKAFASFADVEIVIDEASPLNRVGGSTIVDSPSGKIIIVRTGDTAFLAYSARCTHKSSTVGYDGEKRQFVCPKHGSKFDGATGKVVNGPAETDLASFAAKGTPKSVIVTVGQ